jgi:hypothetical protein
MKQCIQLFAVKLPRCICLCEGKGEWSRLGSVHIISSYQNRPLVAMTTSRANKSKGKKKRPYKYDFIFMKELSAILRDDAISKAWHLFDWRLSRVTSFSMWL